VARFRLESESGTGTISGAIGTVIVTETAILEIETRETETRETGIQEIGSIMINGCRERKEREITSATLKNRYLRARRHCARPRPRG
jgi:hypothetical protein